MKKMIFAFIFIGMLSFSLGIVSSALEVRQKAIQDSYIIDLNQPAVFELTIHNLGYTEDFEIYSLIGVDILPKEAFRIQKDESKKIVIELVPQEALKSRKGYLTFEYLIKGQSTLEREKLTFNIINLEDAFLITPENIFINSNLMRVSVRNKVNLDFDDFNFRFSSAFFDYTNSFQLKAFETKQIDIPLKESKLKTMTAGSYLAEASVETSGEKAKKEISIIFAEQQNIESREEESGILIRKTDIIRINHGNTKETVEIHLQRNLLQNFFTTFNVNPTKTETKGFTKYYTWKGEILPNQELIITAKTNWLYPILLLALIVIFVILIKRAVQTDLILRKRVSFIRTKGGEFALKITIKARAKRYIERVHIVDRLPPIVKLYERFGAVSPSKIDLTNRMLEWNIGSLNYGQERAVSYIVYSKVGVVGRFELPCATAIYEIEEKIKRAVSNKSFFVNESQKQKL